MSAKLEAQILDWETADIAGQTGHKDPSEVEEECLCRNADEHTLIGPLREARAVLAQAGHLNREADEKRRATLALQAQWNGWFTERERLRLEIKRGRELLGQVQEELASLEPCLEKWPDYERVCGQNPLFDYMQSALSKRRVTEFLPGWLQRREEELNVLQARMAEFAGQNGLQELL